MCKSSGIFAIFRRLKIEGGGVKSTIFGKIVTKDRNFLLFSDKTNFMPYTI